MGSSNRRAQGTGRVILGIAISVVALWIALRSVPLDALALSLKSANYWWLAAYPPLAIALNLLRGEIWRRLLSRRATTIDAFWAYCVGFLVNNVMPFRMGEAARVLALSAKSGLPVVEVGTAAALERLCDLAAILVIVIAVFPFLANAGDVERAAWWAAGLIVLAVLIVAAAVAGRHQVDKLVKRICRTVLPRHAELVIARWRELMNALDVVRDPAIAAPVLLGCATVWVLTIILQWTVLKAFQPAAGLPDAAVLVAMVSLGGAIPAAPGGIGTYQWVGQQALTLPYPELYPPALALAAAVISHAASYLFSTLLGAIGVWHLGIPLAQIRRPAAPEPALGESRL